MDAPFLQQVDAFSVWDALDFNRVPDEIANRDRVFEDSVDTQGKTRPIFAFISPLPSWVVARSVSKHSRTRCS
jgi:hypothetical protein